MSAEARYHPDCQVRFHDGRLLEKLARGRPAGSVDSSKQDAFLKFCDHSDKSDEHQYSLSDLETILQTCSDSGEILLQSS